MRREKVTGRRCSKRCGDWRRSRSWSAPSYRRALRTGLAVRLRPTPLAFRRTHGRKSRGARTSRIACRASSHIDPMQFRRKRESISRPRSPRSRCAVRSSARARPRRPSDAAAREPSLPRRRDRPGAHRRRPAESVGEALARARSRRSGLPLTARSRRRPALRMPASRPHLPIRRATTSGPSRQTRRHAARASRPARLRGRLERIARRDRGHDPQPRRSCAAQCGHCA